MNKNFKWDMLVTSFFPLWISIIIIDLWKVISYGKTVWNNEVGFFANIWNIFQNSAVVVIFMLAVFFVMLISSIKINKFISLQKKNADDLPKAQITNVNKNSNLSPEFLIAYILPMLVFDFVSVLHIILFILYFFTLAFLSIRNNHVYVNIFLEFKRYKIYTADIVLHLIEKEKEYKNCIILSKNDLCSKNNDNINYYDLEKTIYLDATKEE